VKVDHSAGHAYASFRLRWKRDDGKKPSVGIDDNRFLVIGSKLDNLGIFFNSREFDGKDPYLKITYTLMYGVSASISPSYQSGLPGVTLNYTVTVKNEGIVMDAYSLTTADNAGWSRTISPSSLSLAAGASGTATLTVSIPSGAENCTKDNVRVIATGTGVSAENSCIAHATAAPPPPPPPPGDNTPPSTPSLVSPTNGANITDNTPPLDWSEVSDPSGVTYDVSIARDAGFVSIVLQKTGLTASTYELTQAEALAAGTYYWRARAVDGAGNVGSWSENWSFTVSTAPSPPGDNTPPPTPSLFSPTNGANITDNTPLLDWSNVSDPSGVTYDLSIAGDAGFASIILQKTGLMVSNYELTLAEALAAGTYYWRVRAVDGAGNVGSWSENWSFTVSIAPSPPVSVEISLITAIALLVVAMIAAIALYLIKRRKRHISGPRHGVLRRTHR